MSPRPRRSLLREEATDARLGLRVFALADVAVTNDASPVDEDQRRPPAHGVAVPDGEVVVLHDGVLDPELAHGVHDLVERLLPAELRAVHADDGQPLPRVPRMPVPQLRDHVLAVVSAERPELDRHHAAAQGVDRQRRAVDPLAGGDLRRGGARRGLGGRPAGAGEVLFFLHADSMPPPDALARIAAALADPRVVGGAFEHRFAEPAWSLRAINLVNRIRYRLTRNWYGDQGIFVRAEVFRALGGYRDLRLMEDLDFSQRLKARGRSVLVDAPVVTSGRRFLARGPWRTLFFIVWLLARWTLGLDTERYAERWRG